MLELRNFPERLKRKGAGTVSEMEDVLERLPDELARNVMRQGILLGHALLLRDQAARRFDKRTAAWLCYLVDLSGRDSIDRVATALFECGTEAEFLERVQTENGKPPQTGGAQDVEAHRSTGGTSRKKITGRTLWRWPEPLPAPHPRQKVVRSVAIHDRRRHTVDPFPIWSSPQQPRQLAPVAERPAANARPRVHRWTGSGWNGLGVRGPGLLQPPRGSGAGT